MYADQVQDAVPSDPSAGRRWLRRFASVVLTATVGFGGLAVASATPVAAACAHSAIDSVEAEAQQSMVDKLNALRAGKGLRGLVVNPKITGPAISWSQTMSGQNWLHHARDTGSGDGVEPHQDYVYLVGSVVPNWSRVAENVGVTGMGSWCSSSELRSRALSAASSLHNAFVNSSGHYKNMVGDFNQVGIGIHIDSDQLWVTVRFAKGDLPVTVTAATSKYLDAVYTLFVKRLANSSEDTYWASAVQSGNRAAVTSALAVSDEWAGVRVNDLYRKVLGRDADAQGRAFWVGKIAKGLRLEDVAAEMYASPEYFKRKGSTNTGFVTGLYRDILHRSPDTAGLNHWTSLLHWNLINRRGVSASFYASIESRRDRVTTLYHEILRRDTDTAGREYWAKQLLRMGDVVLASQLASSKEFYDKSIR